MNILKLYLGGLPLGSWPKIAPNTEESACVHAQLLNHVWLCVTPWTVACQAPLSVGFSRQESWSGLPCPPPGDLPDPQIKPESSESPASPALQADSLLLKHRGSPPKGPDYSKDRWGALSLCLTLRDNWAVQRICSPCAPTLAVKENSPLTQSPLPTLISPSTWLLLEHVSICPDTDEPRPWRLRSHGPRPRSRLCRGLRLHPEACREFVSRAGSCCWVCSGVGSISTSAPSAPVWRVIITGVGRQSLEQEADSFTHSLVVLTDVCHPTQDGCYGWSPGSILNTTWVIGILWEAVKALFSGSWWSYNCSMKSLRLTILSESVLRTLIEGEAFFSPLFSNTMKKKCVWVSTFLLPFI